MADGSGFSTLNMVDFLDLVLVLFLPKKIIFFALFALHCFDWSRQTIGMGQEGHRSMSPIVEYLDTKINEKMAMIE
jgi:hypothetical protein